MLLGWRYTGVCEFRIDEILISYRHSLFAGDFKDYTNMQLHNLLLIHQL